MPRCPANVSGEAVVKDIEHGNATWHDWRRETLIVIAILTAVTCLFNFEIDRWREIMKPVPSMVTRYYALQPAEARAMRNALVARVADDQERDEPTEQ